MEDLQRRLNGGGRVLSGLILFGLGLPGAVGLDILTYVPRVVQADDDEEVVPATVTVYRAARDSLVGGIRQLFGADDD